MRQRTRQGCSHFIVLVLILAGISTADAAVPFRVIEGDPLTIHFGADLSFQIFNADVPGSGQIFPTGCAETADMGIMADIGGILFAPDFTGHDCSTATGSLRPYEAWTQLALEEVTGDGSAETPFRVSAVVLAGQSGVQARTTVTYVNGQNFFRIRTVYTALQQVRGIRTWLGADIFLASSDAGIFHFEPELSSPGGTNCTDPPTYTILLIPVTSPDSFTGNQFNNVWQQIGAGALDGVAEASTCQDNGAALEWDRVLLPGEPVSIRSAVSFGTVPSPRHFRLLSLDVSGPIQLRNGEEGSFVLTSFRDEDFNAEVSLAPGELPEGFEASISPVSIPAPGFGTAVLTVSVGSRVLPGTYLIPVVGTGGDETASVSATVEVVCDPPMILSRTEFQPKSQTVAFGSRASLSVTPAREGVHFYQWYQGPSGSTLFPIPGARSEFLLTPPITVPTDFWVRITNACGSADSWTATMTPSGSAGAEVQPPAPGRRRGVRPRGD